MTSNLALRFLLIAGFLVVLYYWLKPATPKEQAEKYSELTLKGNVRVLGHLNGHSFLFGGGIICGELELNKGQVESIASEAIYKGYIFADNLGLSAPIGVVTQEGCCDRTNTMLNKHGGFYKVFLENAKESRYAIIDTTARRLYFFKASASSLF